MPTKKGILFWAKWVIFLLIYKLYRLLPYMVYDLCLKSDIDNYMQLVKYTF
jgi:hypothetical protein